MGHTVTVAGFVVATRLTKSLSQIPQDFQSPFAHSAGDQSSQQQLLRLFLQCVHTPNPQQLPKITGKHLEGVVPFDPHPGQPPPCHLMAQQLQVQKWEMAQRQSCPRSSKYATFLFFQMMASGRQFSQGREAWSWRSKSTGVRAYPTKLLGEC